MTSPILTMPCGWNVLKFIGTDSASFHGTARVSFFTRSLTSAP